MLLIKNGKFVLPTETILADLLIEDGKINKIGTNLSKAEYRILDAKGSLVLPAGIDPHVHLSLPTPVGLSSDDFESGSKAALAGGTTTFIDFITPRKGQKLIDAYKDRIAEVRNCHCDYAFHMSIIEWRNSIPEEMEACVKELGITSFKTYLAYRKSVGISFGELEKVMTTAKLLNVMVTIHSELGDTIDELREEAILNGQKDLTYHAKTRPDSTEYQAVEKVIQLIRKTNCLTYIVHVSTAESLNKIKLAQKEGLPVFAESCPQYFTFEESVYQKPKAESSAFIISPPIRSEENRQGIENGILDQTVSTIGTDHCPFTLAQKLNVDNFTEIPNGTGGIQHRLSLVYSHFVHSKHMSINDMTKLISTAAAHLFRLPQKGKIEVGYDADLVIWKESSTRAGEQILYSQSDLDIYKNEKIVGKADIVIKSGQIVYQNGKVMNELPIGHYIYRK